MAAEQPSAEPVVAAGAVLWRHADSGGLEVAVVHRPRYDDWSLPKGKLEAGEPALDAAVREVREETGYAVRVGAALGTIGYPQRRGGRLRDKVVHYWAMQDAGGGFEPNPEVDQLRWLAPAPARALLSYGRDRDVLDRFLALGL